MNAFPFFLNHSQLGDIMSRAAARRDTVVRELVDLPPGEIDRQLTLMAEYTGLLSLMEEIGAEIKRREEMPL